MNAAEINTSLQNIAAAVGIRPSELDLEQLIALARGAQKDYESPPCNAEYMTDLLQDMSLLKIVQNEFIHVGTLLEREIGRVRATQEELARLPPPEGPVVMLNEKIYVPVHEYPNHNFVGRLIGPRGKTAKQLEAETGCKIMIRGKGSMRSKKEEEVYRGRRNYEHLNDDLHIIVSARDTENRAKIKLQKAISEVKKFLRPWNEGEDELKNRQLMELAFLKNNILRPFHAGPPMVFAQTSNPLTDKKSEKLIGPNDFLAHPAFGCINGNVNSIAAQCMHRSPFGDSSSAADLSSCLKNQGVVNFDGLENHNLSPIVSRELLPNNCCGDLRHGVKNLLDFMRNRPLMREDNRYLSPTVLFNQNPLLMETMQPPTPKVLSIGEECKPHNANSLDPSYKKPDTGANGRSTAGVPTRPPKKSKSKKNSNNENGKRNFNSGNMGGDAANRTNGNGLGNWPYEHKKVTGAVKKHN